MFSWYSSASRCFAFLADLEIDPDELDWEDPRGNFPRVFDTPLKRCAWFRRGWTLQELVAPRDVVFLDREWRFYGTKLELADTLARITGINSAILTHQRSLSEVCIAERMSWASHRETTRVEDKAYALLGIFDISMPIIYGEGNRAFLRLQMEIMQQIPDQTLFVWSNGCYSTMNLDVLHPARRLYLQYSPRAADEPASALLANSPRCFARFGPVDGSAHSSVLRSISPEDLARRVGKPNRAWPSCSINPYGVRTRLPLIRLSRVPASLVRPRSASDQWFNQLHLALLACESRCMEGSILAMLCSVQDDCTPRKILSKVQVSTDWDRLSSDYYLPTGNTTFILLPSSLLNQISADDICDTDLSIPLTARSSNALNVGPAPVIPLEECHGSTLVLQNLQVLRDSGYTVSLEYRIRPLPDFGRVFAVDLSRDQFKVFIELTITVHWLYQYGPSCAVNLNVGRKLEVNSPLSHAGAHHTSVEMIESIRQFTISPILRDITIPFVSHRGMPTVTLRIAFAHNLPSHTWHLNLDVIGFDAAQRSLRASKGRM